MTVQEKIANFKKVIAQLKKGWCRGSYARDNTGISVDFGDPRACSWCLMGAMYVVIAPTAQKPSHLSGTEGGIRSALVSELSSTLALTDAPERNLIPFNDEVCQTQEDAIDLIRKTINRLEGINV